MVNKDGTYAGLLFYHVLLHYFSSVREGTSPLFQKLRELFGTDAYFYNFYLKETKRFREEMGTARLESLYKLLLEDVKDHIKEMPSFPWRTERSTCCLAKSGGRKIKLLMEEFHREFSLLYGESKPVHVCGFCVPLKDVKNYEECFSISTQLKERLKSTPDVSFLYTTAFSPVWWSVNIREGSI